MKETGLLNKELTELLKKVEAEYTKKGKQDSIVNEYKFIEQSLQIAQTVNVLNAKNSKQAKDALMNFRKQSDKIQKDLVKIKKQYDSASHFKEKETLNQKYNEQLSKLEGMVSTNKRRFKIPSDINMKDKDVQKWMSKKISLVSKDVNRLYIDAFNNKLKTNDPYMLKYGKLFDIENVKKYDENIKKVLSNFSDPKFLNNPVIKALEKLDINISEHIKKPILNQPQDNQSNVVMLSEEEIETLRQKRIKEDEALSKAREQQRMKEFIRARTQEINFRKMKLRLAVEDVEIYNKLSDSEKILVEEQREKNRLKHEEYKVNQQLSLQSKKISLQQKQERLSQQKYNERVGKLKTAANVLTLGQFKRRSILRRIVGIDQGRFGGMMGGMGLGGMGMRGGAMGLLMSPLIATILGAKAVGAVGGALGSVGKGIGTGLGGLISGVGLSLPILAAGLSSFMAPPVIAGAAVFSAFIGAMALSGMAVGKAIEMFGEGISKFSGGMETLSKVNFDEERSNRLINFSKNFMSSFSVGDAAKIFAVSGSFEQMANSLVKLSSAPTIDIQKSEGIKNILNSIKEYSDKGVFDTITSIFTTDKDPLQKIGLSLKNLADININKDFMENVPKFLSEINKVSSEVFDNKKFEYGMLKISRGLDNSNIKNIIQGAESPLTTSLDNAKLMNNQNTLDKNIDSSDVKKLMLNSISNNQIINNMSSNQTFGINIPARREKTVNDYILGRN